MDRYEIAVIPGDGIGPEVVDAALAVLAACQERYGVRLEYAFHDFSADLYRRTGRVISIEDMDRMSTESHAVLFGAMGLPDVRDPNGLELGAQIALRHHWGLFASLRPARLFDGVESAVRARDVDMLVIRETTEGMFAGLGDVHEPSDEVASDRMTITRANCERLFDVAFEQARERRARGTAGHVTLLHKSNALRSNVLMERVFDEVATSNADVGSAKLYVDAGSMLMVTNPERFDVIVTENIFGDIASEIAAGLVGGLGVAPSADLSRTRGVFQPSHGSAPDIAGQGLANPVAMILSAAMMLDWLGAQHHDRRLVEAAGSIRVAVEATLAAGATTRDLGGTASTSDVVDAVVAALPSVVRA